MRILSVLITVIMYGRMIEIYLYTSVAPIPFATMSNREWGQIGTNYFRGLFVKSKVTDINRMKIEEQKKAVRSGYDMGATRSLITA